MGDLNQIQELLHQKADLQARIIPFEISAAVPSGRKPVALGSLTKEEFDAELELGMDDIRSGRVYTESEVFEEMHRL